MSSAEARLEDKGLILEAYGKEFDLSRAWEYVEIFTLTLPPGTLEGQLIVTGNVIESPTLANGSGYFFSTLDLRFVGAAGAAENVLKLDVLNGAAIISICPIPAEARWERLQVKARISLDGVFGDVAAAYAAAMGLADNFARATVVGRFRKAVP